jgi:hypothetical protein
MIVTRTSVIFTRFPFEPTGPRDDGPGRDALQGQSRRAAAAASGQRDLDRLVELVVADAPVV